METRIGLEALDVVTTLLSRTRAMHPTAGLYEAADLQWWWREPRSTDELPQLFWFEADGRPAAAAIATDWGKRISLDPMVLPGASADDLVAVMRAGLDHLAAHGHGTATLEIGPDATTLRAFLIARGFTSEGTAITEGWLDIDRRAPVTTLAEGYRLSSRADLAGSPHHMIEINGPDVEARLRQGSLYRPDLDLVVQDSAGAFASQGLFWFDPTTETGLVEPMRTEEQHRRRGLARHVITEGLDRLARAGARRVKIVWESDNAPAGDLYLDVGFVADRETEFLSGPTRAG